ncbi:hypothetical protein EV2_014301 [Malus domestica]
MNFQPMCRFGGYMLKDSTGLAQTIQTYARTKQPHRVSTMHPSREPSCYHRNLVSWTAMITRFSQNLGFSETLKTFSQMRELPCKDALSWTSLIDGYAKSGDSEAALLTYKRMIVDGIVIDQHVLCTALNACPALKDCKFGKCLHSTVLKLGLQTEVSVGNALTDMYVKNKKRCAEIISL